MKEQKIHSQQWQLTLLQKKANLFFIILLAVFFTGCVHKRYAKEALRYEQSAMYGLAVEKYMSALASRHDYVTARIGLMRACTNYADELQQKIETSYASLNDNGVVDNYLALFRLKENAAKYMVDVHITSRTEGQYLEASHRYVSNYYAEAQTLIDAELFAEALVKLEQIARVNASYENITDLIVYCKCEPLYRKGKQLMQISKYRNAYLELGKILLIDIAYKDVQQLRVETIEKGTLTIALSPQNSYYKPVLDKLAVEIKTNVQKANNPFLQIVDRTQAQAILAIQKEAMANNIDIDANKQIPLRSLLSYKLIQYVYSTTKLIETKKKGVIKTKQEDDTYIYRKVYYYEYEQNAKLQISFVYDLISTETNLVLLSGNTTPFANDAIHYVTCKSGIVDLYSGNWENIDAPFNKEKDVINDGILQRTYFNTLKEARTKLKTASELEPYLLTNIAADVTQRLLKYNPE